MHLSPVTSRRQTRPFDASSAMLLQVWLQLQRTPALLGIGIREGFASLRRSIIAGVAQRVAHDDRKHAETKLQVARLQRNEADAWEKLVQEWSPRLFGYLRNHVPTREDAQDLLSETFAAAVKSMQKFDGNAALSTWLYALAHNKMVDFWRRTRIETELPATLVMADDETSLDFRQAFARLPALSRNVLDLRYVQGLGVGEIASVLNRTYKATESLLGRSRAMLKTALQEAGIVLEK